MRLLTAHKKPSTAIWALAIAVVLFDAQYYMMRTLPGGGENFVCKMGGSLTEGNILFAAFFSILVGILAGGFITLYGQRVVKRDLALTSSFTGLGAVIGTFTVFCTICTLPVISLFGISSILALFTDHNLLFKVISVLFLGVSLFMLNRQLENKCITCKVPV